MVKILAISGSPRKKATLKALTIAADAAREEGAEVEVVSLASKKISLCIHCNKCIRDESDICTLYDDDMTELYQKFYDADGVLIASPVYEMNITAQLAAFFNRFRPTYLTLKDDPDYFMRKVGGAIAVGGTRNGGQEHTIQAIHNFYATNGLTPVIGGLFTYGGASVWSKDQGAEGVLDDQVGVNSCRIIGRRVAKMAKIIKGEV